MKKLISTLIVTICSVLLFACPIGLFAEEVGHIQPTEHNIMLLGSNQPEDSSTDSYLFTDESNNLTKSMFDRLFTAVKKFVIGFIVIVIVLIIASIVVTILHNKKKKTEQEHLHQGPFEEYPRS